MLDLAGARADPTGPTVRGAGDLGELLDTRARAEYRRRLAELEDEVADAERCDDLGPSRARPAPSGTSSRPNSPPPSASTADPAAPVTPPNGPARP